MNNKTRKELIAEIECLEGELEECEEKLYTLAQNVYDRTVNVPALLLTPAERKAYALAQAILNK